MNVIQLGVPPPAAVSGAPPDGANVAGSAAVASPAGAPIDGEPPFAAALALANADAVSGASGGTGAPTEEDAALMALAELAAALAGAAPPIEVGAPTETQGIDRLDRIAGAGSEEPGAIDASDLAVMAQPGVVPLVAEAPRMELGVAAVVMEPAAPVVSSAVASAPAPVAGVSASVLTEVAVAAPAPTVPVAASEQAAPVVASAQAAAAIAIEAVAPTALGVEQAAAPASAVAAAEAAAVAEGAAPSELASTSPTSTAATAVAEVATRLAPSADAEPIAALFGDAPGVEAAPVESVATVAAAAAAPTQPGGVQSPTAPAGAVSTVDEPSATAAELSSRFTDLVQSAALRGDRELRMRLRPPELGQLDVRIEQGTEGLRISIVASTREGHELLARQLPLLQSALESRDLRVDRLVTELLAESEPGSRPGVGSEQAAGRGEAGAGDESGDAPEWSALAAQQGTAGGADDAAITGETSSGRPPSVGRMGPDGIDVLA